MRVQERAINAAGPSAPAVSGATAPVRAGTVTTAQIRALLRRQIVPRGAATKIASTLARGDTVLAFTALETGRAVVAWYVAPPKHGKRVLVARGSRSFTRAAASTIDVRLSLAGIRALNAARRLRLTAQGTFTPTAKAKVSATAVFLLKR
jgi:hypothetical protein